MPVMMGQDENGQGGVLINDPNNLDEILAKVFNIDYPTFVQLQANKDTSNFNVGQGVGGMVKALAPIWGPAVTAGLAPAGTFDAAQPGVFEAGSAAAGGEAAAGGSATAGASAAPTTPLATSAASASGGGAAGGNVGVGIDGVDYGKIFDGTGTNALAGTGNMGTLAGAALIDKLKSAAGTAGTAAVAGKLLGSAIPSGGAGAGGDGGFAAGQQAEEDRKAGLRKKINLLYGIDDGSGDPQAAAAQQAMSKEESDLSDATRGFYDEQLQHDSEKALRENRFALADRGTLGGSAQIDTERELGRDKAIGATRIQDQVENALSQLRSGRESERLNATNLVNAGAGEDAVAGAEAGLTRSLQNAQATQHASLTSDLFAGGANSVSAASNPYNPALLAAYQNRLSSFFGPGTGSTARSTPT